MSAFFFLFNFFGFQGSPFADYKASKVESGDIHVCRTLDWPRRGIQDEHMGPALNYLVGEIIGPQHLCRQLHVQGPITHGFLFQRSGGLK